jgi:ribosomal protein L11 methyltransferase
VLRTSITVRDADVEEVLDVLLALVPAGIHDRPAGEGMVELAWYGPRRALPEELGDLIVTFSSEDAPEDAAGRRRAFGQAVVVAGAVAIRSPDDPPGPPGVPEVVIEAGHGEFGSGTHPTTRACVEALLRLEPGGSLADLGCGSGVLAIVAARMGYAPVVAVDYEPASVEATRRNAARNGAAVRAAQGDLASGPPPAARSYVANIPLAIHRHVAARLPPEAEVVVASGVITEEAADAVAAYVAAGFAMEGHLDEQGWTTALLRRALA